MQLRELWNWICALRWRNFDTSTPRFPTSQKLSGSRHNIPLTEIIPARDGSWYLSPLDLSQLEDSDYDVVYLMRSVSGKPMHQTNALQLCQYAETMAHFHRLGMEYPHPVMVRE